jgi:hypothetical protein
MKQETWEIEFDKKFVNLCTIKFIKYKRNHKDIDVKEKVKDFIRFLLKGRLDKNWECLLEYSFSDKLTDKEKDIIRNNVRLLLENQQDEIKKHKVKNKIINIIK